MFFRLLCMFVLAVALMSPGSAGAHPHVFVEPEVALEFDGHGLAGVRQIWIFDEMFTAMMLQDYDVNADGVLSSAEVAALKEGGFDNVAEWGYFTYLKVAGQSVPVKSVREFRARVEKGALVYEFYVPLNVPIGTKFSLSVFDPDYYVDFLPPLRESVALKNAQPYAVRLDIAEDPGAVYSDWMITPTVINIQFNKK